MAGFSNDPTLGIQETNSDDDGIGSIKLLLEREVEGTSRIEDEEIEKSPTVGNSIHRSGSRPQLDVSGAAIQGNFEERNPTILLPNQYDDVSHLALDIGVGGSLIKLVCFSRHEDKYVEDKRKRSLKQRFGISDKTWRSYLVLGGSLHFVKFETTKIDVCLNFINSKKLHCGDMSRSQV
ncbi:unnamed protein product [Amaranthus hypochondriacus]